jgi:hypothetical protein
MSTLLIPSTLFATRRVSLGHSPWAAIAAGVAAALAAFLLGPAGLDHEFGMTDVLHGRSLRPGSV